jgi:hypothetical protein
VGPAAVPCLGEITMSHVYEVPAEFARKARVTAERYRADYARSIQDPSAF